MPEPNYRIPALNAEAWRVATSPAAGSEGSRTVGWRVFLTWYDCYLLHINELITNDQHMAKCLPGTEFWSCWRRLFVLAAGSLRWRGLAENLQVTAAAL